MEQEVWLKIANGTGERYAMILSEDIRAKRFANTICWGRKVFSLLGKIHQAIQNNKRSINISCEEAEALFQCLNSYFEDYSCSPFDKPSPLGNYRWSGGSTLVYPRELVIAQEKMS